MTPIYPSETLPRRRVVGDLAGADRIMNESIFIGTCPGLTKEMPGYTVETSTQFVRAR